MSIQQQELAAALTDVRRAFRLVYAYQRRLFDLYAEVDAVLLEKGLAFDQWGAVFNAPPPRKGTPFFRNRWAWDMLPGYAVGSFWADEKPRKGLRRRFLLQALADTGRTFSGAEPDPVQFEAVEESRSALRMARWTTTAGSPDWNGAWQMVSSKDWSWKGRATVELDGATYTYEYEERDLTELVDPAAVRALLLDPLGRWADDPLGG